MRPSIWTVLVTLGCNQVIGADPPTIEKPEPSLPSTADDHDSPDAALPDPVCGDGRIEWGEECDDGNQDPGDGCSECKIVCGPAPEVIDPTSGHCYRFSRPGDARSWDGAHADCQTWGGDLASLGSPDELGLVQVRVSENTWIGGRKTSTGFGWSDGEAWSFEPWAPSQPSPAGDCVQMDGSLSGFRVTDCAQPAVFLCERAPAGQLE